MFNDNLDSWLFGSCCPTRKAFHGVDVFVYSYAPLNKLSGKILFFCFSVSFAIMLLTSYMASIVVTQSS